MYLSHTMIYLVHMLFVAPLLMYAGHAGYTNCPKTHDKNIFLFLGAVGLVVFIYHLFLYHKNYSNQ